MPVHTSLNDLLAKAARQIETEISYVKEQATKGGPTLPVFTDPAITQKAKDTIYADLGRLFEEYERITIGAPFVINGVNYPGENAAVFSFRGDEPLDVKTNLGEYDFKGGAKDNLVRLIQPTASLELSRLTAHRQQTKIFYSSDLKEVKSSEVKAEIDKALGLVNAHPDTLTGQLEVSMELQIKPNERTIPIFGKGPKTGCLTVGISVGKDTLEELTGRFLNGEDIYTELESMAVEQFLPLVHT